MAEQDEQLKSPKHPLVVIVMGSEKDQGYADRIVTTLGEFEVPVELRVASAHKSIAHLLELIGAYNNQEDKSIVFIAVAGRSNALGGVIDANTAFPVISAPPYSETYAGADIFSSLRMPSGIATTVATEPEMAALAAVKMLALNNPELADKVLAYQRRALQKILEADHRVQNPIS